MSLAIDIGRATIAGIAARKANAKLTFDADGLTVERLSLGEFGGASLNASGRISMATAAPRGSLTVDLDARDLTGLSALLAKFAPATPAPAQRMIERLGASKLRATLDVTEAAEKGRSAARVTIGGESGGLRLALKADVSGDHANVMKAVGRVDASLEADDSGRMFRLIGLDRPAAAAKGPGRFSINAQGPLDGAINLDGRITAADSLDARLHGTMRIASETSGQFDLAVTHADLGWLRAPGAANRLTAALTSRVTVNGRQLKFENAMASVAGAAMRGKFDLDLTAAPRVTGELNADRSTPPPSLRASPGCRPAAATDPGRPSRSETDCSAACPAGSP